MKRRDERVIEALVETARPIILGGVGTYAFRRDSCIASTRIGTLALAEFGVRAHVIGASYIMFNAAYRRQVAEDGGVPASVEDYREDSHSLGLGLPPFDDGNIGHFVIAIGGSLMVDLSADQLSRPEKGWTIDRPIVANMPAGWKKGRERVWTHTDAYSVGIQAEPANKNFVRSRDWTLRSRYQPFVAAVTAAMRAHLAR
jgi:hypothetical protein